MSSDRELEQLDALLRFSEAVTKIEDIDTLLDRVLLEARKYTGAEAGSIYLIKNQNLHISYVQNDHLFRTHKNSNQFIYTKHSLPINQESLAGYVATTGSALQLENAYKIPTSAPYRFNSSFDENTGYRTRTILTSPLKTQSNTLIGVIQLINKGEQLNFNPEDQLYLQHFSNIASNAIGRAQRSKTFFLRMIRMAELRDPKETGAHVNRVGSYSIEIYDAWARKREISPEEIRTFNSKFRMAAMLHDIGKVATPDLILKKPGRLDQDEYEIMKKHTSLGAVLFEGSDSLQDRMIHDVTLNHHEMWNGKGYPSGLKGVEIPLVARIVSLADVYDALISERVYKKAWSEEEVCHYLQEQSGKQFDPELVEIFFSIEETIQAIRYKYQESSVDELPQLDSI